MSRVSWAIRARRSSGRWCSVRMLWSRSASLTRMTRMSSTIASSILRKLSAWRSSLDANCSALKLRDAFDHVRHFLAEQLPDLLDGVRRVLDDVVQQAGGDRHGVEPHVGQDVGHLERMDEVGLARAAHLAAMLVGGKDVRPPEQLGVGLRVGGTHLLDEVLEPDHGRSVSNRGEAGNRRRVPDPAAESMIPESARPPGNRARNGPSAGVRRA